jgi:hypothetical protein
MSGVCERVEMVLEISAAIRELDLEAEPLMDRLAQIEVRRADFKARIAVIVGDGVALMSATPPPRKKRPFAGTGFIGVLLRYLQDNPGVEVSPESAAAAVGHPERNGLAGTCLKRLHDAGLVAKPGVGRYVYLAKSPSSSQMEAAMT